MVSKVAEDFRTILKTHGIKTKIVKVSPSGSIDAWGNRLKTYTIIWTTGIIQPVTEYEVRREPAGVLQVGDGIGFFPSGTDCIPSGSESEWYAYPSGLNIKYKIAFGRREIYAGEVGFIECGLQFQMGSGVS
jgi:hypothetical protein